MSLSTLSHNLKEKKQKKRKSTSPKTKPTLSEQEETISRTTLSSPVRQALSILSFNASIFVVCLFFGVVCFLLVLMWCVVRRKRWKDFFQRQDDVAVER